MERAQWDRMDEYIKGMSRQGLVKDQLTIERWFSAQGVTLNARQKLVVLGALVREK